MNDKKHQSMIDGLRDVVRRITGEDDRRKNLVSGLAAIARGQANRPRSTELSRAAKGLK